MPLTPGYGETPLPHDERTALLPHVVEVLETPVSRAAVYDLEQAVQEQVSEELLTAAFSGSLSLDELLTDYFVRDLHERLYGDIWSWAGRWRQRDVNIGVDPRQVAVELRSALDNIRYRWEHTDDWTARELGLTTHARLCGYTRSRTEMAAPQGFLPISCSSPPRILLSSSTTGTSTSGATSSCSVVSIRIETLVSSRPSSVCSRLSSEQFGAAAVDACGNSPERCDKAVRHVNETTAKRLVS
jgi:hypothetical protein